MKRFDVSQVDGKLLIIFQTVFETGSVTKAADQLVLSQSLVSHSLDRLRSAFGDRLFIRAGRSIAPTDRAYELAPKINQIIEQIALLTEPSELNLKALEADFSFGTNDYERRLLAPAIVSKFLAAAPKATIRFSPMPEVIAETLRGRACDLIVSPLSPPDLNDLYSEPLFEDQYVSFFDQTQLTADEVSASYADMEHAVVLYGGARSTRVDEVLADHGIIRKVRLVTPSFESLPGLVSGSRLVATVPSRIANGFAANLARVDFPFPSPRLHFRMVWHQATHDSAKHRWFRSVVREATAASGLTQLLIS
jgi:DNA-binding transcriptional LysR family regulator